MKYKGIKHQREAIPYNKEWRVFLELNPKVDIDGILEFTKKICDKYGYKINF